MRPSPSPVNIHGLPRIATFADLASRTGLTLRQLWWLLFAGPAMYTLFRVPKKAGGYRLIARPNRVLRFAQTWILRNILDRLHVTSNCHGFARGSNLRSHAQCHAAAGAVLSLDIENFFPSISIAQVTSVFRAAGYSARVASMLARLCTCMGALPQGAPSSPKLANLVCYRMDRRLAEFAARRGFVYTRYADDMSFSATAPGQLAKARPFIAYIVHDCGFRLNTRKTRLVDGRRALIVTGLIVGPDKVGVGRQRLRELRARIHHVHKGSDMDIDSIQGWLDFVSDVDPDRYKVLVRYVDSLRATHAGSRLQALRVRASVC